MIGGQRQGRGKYFDFFFNTYFKIGKRIYPSCDFLFYFFYWCKRQGRGKSENIIIW